MKEIVKALKWIIPLQAIGLVCSYIAYWLPGPKEKPFKNSLFFYGFSLMLNSLVQLISKVYKPLKEIE